MFSFLSFFGKMYLKYSSFNFLFPFYQLRVNDKIEIERKNWLFISAFQQMRISIGERKKKSFLTFFTKANNKKSISNDFFTKRLSFIALSQASFENWYSISETVFQPRYQLHSPIYSACLIVFLFHFWYIPATEDVILFFQMIKILN